MPALHGAMPVLVELLGATDSCPERNRTITIITAIITITITIRKIPGIIQLRGKYRPMTDPQQ
jgi:hypothetical protein